MGVTIEQCRLIISWRSTCRILKPLVVQQKSIEVAESESASIENSSMRDEATSNVDNDIASREHLASAYAVTQNAETCCGAINEVCRNR